MQKKKWCKYCGAKTMHEDWQVTTMREYSKLEKLLRIDKRKTWQCMSCGEVKR